MDDWDLIDVKPRRGKFTWTSRSVDMGHITGRMDRFLIHGHFLEDDINLS
jgi:hypothetical protein